MITKIITMDSKLSVKPPLDNRSLIQIAREIHAREKIKVSWIDATDPPIIQYQLCHLVHYYQP